MEMKLFSITILIVLATNKIALSQNTDKKCKEIYAALTLKDSLLKVSYASNDSLLKANNELQLVLNNSTLQLSDLQRQLASIEYEKKLIKIGSQKWDSDNLKVTTLNDGSPIFFADTRVKWDSLYKIGEPAYCFHKNDSTGSYGYLYNYYAIKSGKLAPDGMRIPSRIDFDELIKIVVIEQTKGALLLKSKDTSTTYLPKWKTPGLDRYNMNFKPCGFRLDDSKEWYFANKVYYWCQFKDPRKIEMFIITEINDNPFFLEKTVEEKNINYGLYVRCIKQ
jgi:uncharacterized protein (TIGR02145 family)